MQLVQLLFEANKHKQAQHRVLTCELMICISSIIVSYVMYISTIIGLFLYYISYRIHTVAGAINYCYVCHTQDFRANVCFCVLLFS